MNLKSVKILMTIAIVCLVLLGIMELVNGNFSGVLYRLVEILVVCLAYMGLLKYWRNNGKYD